MKVLIDKAKINKSSLLPKTGIDKTEILGETYIANEFNNFFTDIGLKLINKIPESSLPFENYMEVQKWKINLFLSMN